MKLSHWIILTAVLTVGMVNSASAEFIRPVTANATSTFGPNTDPLHLIQLAGTPGDVTLTAENASATHGEDGGGTDFGQWTTAVGTTSASVTLDLGGTFYLSQAHLWQANQTGVLNRGTNQFSFAVSNDHGISFQIVGGTETLTVSGGGNISAEHFNLPATATHVRLDIANNHGDPNVVGLSEVRFTGDASANPVLFIRPTAAIADSTFGPNTDALHLIQMAGTPGDITLTAEAASATHAQDGGGTDFGQWTTAVGVTGDTNLTFELGAGELFDVTDMAIWQANQTGVLGRGVNQFDVLVSSNGIDFTEVLTDETLAISPGGNIGAQFIDLIADGISHVRIHIDTNHGDASVVGLSEVRFVGTASVVPEPRSIAVWTVIGIAGLAFAWRVRRRR